MENGTLVLRAVVVSADGRTRLETRIDGPAVEAVELGDAAAEKLLAQGAGALISQAKSN